MRSALWLITLFTLLLAGVLLFAGHGGEYATNFFNMISL